MKNSSFATAIPSLQVRNRLPLHIDMIGKVKIRLRERKHEYLRRVLLDVLWGWERYLAQVNADITAV